MRQAVGLSILTIMALLAAMIWFAPVDDTGKTTASPLAVEPVREARNVTPSTILPGPELGETVERLPDPPLPPPKPRKERLYRVIIERPDTLITAKRTVHLQGIQLVAEDAMCPLEDGRTPLCWTLARTHLQRLLRGRAVICTFMLGSDQSGPVDGDCRLGSRDLAQELISHGWAKPL